VEFRWEGSVLYVEAYCRAETRSRRGVKVVFVELSQESRLGRRKRDLRCEVERSEELTTQSARRRVR
jgi:hypothetical protein